MRIIQAGRRAAPKGYFLAGIVERASQKAVLKQHGHLKKHWALDADRYDAAVELANLVFDRPAQQRSS